MGPLSTPARNGTIGAMSGHRIRLTDDELFEITSALRARAAMRGAKRRTTLLRLADRLDDCSAGNPRLRLHGECVHGTALQVDCPQCVERILKYVPPEDPEEPPMSRRDRVAAVASLVAAIGGEVTVGRFEALRNTEVP